MPKCRQRASNWWFRASTMSAGKGEEGRMWSCCAVKQLQFYHRLTGRVRWWRCGSRKGCGNTRVWYHRGCVCRGGGMVMGCVEEREKNITCIPSYSHALAIARMACKQLSVVGLQTCAAEVCTHTCSTHAILLTDSPLTGVC